MDHEPDTTTFPETPFAHILTGIAGATLAFIFFVGGVSLATVRTLRNHLAR